METVYCRQTQLQFDEINFFTTVFRKTVLKNFLFTTKKLLAQDQI